MRIQRKCMKLSGKFLTIKFSVTILIDLNFFLVFQMLMHLFLSVPYCLTLSSKPLNPFLHFSVTTSLYAIHNDSPKTLKFDSLNVNQVEI